MCHCNVRVFSDCVIVMAWYSVIVSLYLSQSLWLCHYGVVILLIIWLWYHTFFYFIRIVTVSMLLPKSLLSIFIRIKGINRYCENDPIAKKILHKRKRFGIYCITNNKQKKQFWFLLLMLYHSRYWEVFFLVDWKKKSF